MMAKIGHQTSNLGITIHPISISTCDQKRPHGTNWFLVLVEPRAHTGTCTNAIFNFFGRGKIFSFFTTPSKWNVLQRAVCYIRPHLFSNFNAWVLIGTCLGADISSDHWISVKTLFSPNRRFFKEIFCQNRHISRGDGGKICGQLRSSFILLRATCRIDIHAPQISLFVDICVSVFWFTLISLLS